MDLQPDKLITVDGQVACAGGGMAWWDLGVYLVERYGALQARRYHSDAAVLKLQDWLDANYAKPVTLQTPAALAGLTERSLIRRFKGATGDTPTGYLQVLRIEAARQHLENSRAAVEEVTRLVGYEDVSSFSRLFRRHTGLAPGTYRARFGR